MGVFYVFKIIQMVPNHAKQHICIDYQKKFRSRLSHLMPRSFYITPENIRNQKFLSGIERDLGMKWCKLITCLILV